jgi:hypothetical protein
MQSDDTAAITVDEQLGSPGWTFEKGWLAGVVAGFLGIVLLGRRRARSGSGVSPRPELW